MSKTGDRKSDSTRQGDDLWGAIREALDREGIDVDLVCEGRPGAQPRVICVAATLGDGMQDLAQTARDQVIMARVDKESVAALDAWVSTGVAKTRSEAAALFLREGLRLRAGELAELREALTKVEEAQRELRNRAQAVLGSAPVDSD